MQNDILLTSGLFLKQLRLKHRFSQQYVANYLNLSRNAYAKWESGKTDIALSKLGKLLDLYELSVYDFFIRIPLERSA